MSDIVERLDGTQPMTGSLEDMLREAATEIARLRAALKELADAAEHDMKRNQGEHDDDPGGWWSLRTENAIRVARALENKP